MQATLVEIMQREATAEGNATACKNEIMALKHGQNRILKKLDRIDDMESQIRKNTGRIKVHDNTI